MPAEFRSDNVSIALPLAQWKQVQACMACAPYRESAPLIGEIERQLQMQQNVPFTVAHPADVKRRLAEDG